MLSAGNRKSFCGRTVRHKKKQFLIKSQSEKNVKFPFQNKNKKEVNFIFEPTKEIFFDDVQHTKKESEIIKQ